MKKTTINILLSVTALLILSGSSCKRERNTEVITEQAVKGPEFDADSAYAYCHAQCSFGPRTMNSEAHEQCGEWIAEKFRSLGCEVELQKASLTGYDGTMLRATNIIAHHKPEQKRHILICAHWDSRPWADNDPDSTNWTKPVLAANDGASGVAVMLEVARLLQQVDTLNVGVDFICFDAEDWGVPQWTDRSDGDSWALGAQYWATHQPPKTWETSYGILLDMVGGQGAQFYQEQVSLHYAPSVVDRVWRAATAVGYSGYFSMEKGGAITDDHLPVNEKAGIPCIDIIPYYKNGDCSFGPTWHTIQDDMNHIDKNTLKAVGQTLMQVLLTE
ncbi:MAG: M28 family peptidase [Prevotella sp.]|nr:M28 family peptidase [Prevotella sp.]